MKTQLRRQLSVAIENQPGRLAQVCRLLAKGSIHIDAISIIDNVEAGMVRLVTSDPGQTRASLKETGLPCVEAEVLAVELTDGVGTLAQISEALAGAGINIEYAYASTTGIGQPALVILKTNSARKALDILASLGGPG